MKIWFERALAGLRWVWEAVAWRVKRVWLKLDSLQYDPPPLSYKRMLYGALAFIVAIFIAYHVGKVVGRGGIVSAQSFMSEVGVSFPAWLDEGDVVLPEEHTTFLPEVTAPLPEIKPELICEDMSDTPRCVPVGAKVAAETVESGKEATATVLKPQAKEKLQKKAKSKVRKVKPVSPQDYFCAGFQC